MSNVASETCLMCSLMGFLVGLRLRQRRWRRTVPKAPLARQPCRRTSRYGSRRPGRRKRRRSGPRLLRFEGLGRFAKINASRGTRPRMTYVVTETCIRCKYTDCVDVCPVDCFREGPEFPRHRSGRMHRLHAVRRRMPGRGDLRRGRRARPTSSSSRRSTPSSSKLWKPIIERKPAPPDADEWKDVKDKRQYLER